MGTRCTSSSHGLASSQARAPAEARACLENGQITKRETGPNGAHHAKGDGECQHGGAEGHSHGGILAALTGCDMVLCGGMGWRAAEALKAGGISPVPVSASGSAEELVAAYAAGSLITSNGSFCRCSH